MLLRSGRQDGGPAGSRSSDQRQRRADPVSEDDVLSGYLTRRDVLRLGVAIGGVAATSAVLAACGASGQTTGPTGAASAGATVGPARTPAATKAGGKLVIGAFEDGALAPFKSTILPMFEAATGTMVEFLTEPYAALFTNAFP